MQTKNAADLMMVRDMHSLEIHHKSPTTGMYNFAPRALEKPHLTRFDIVVAISSDINFLPTLNDLKNRAKFDVIVLHLQVNPSIPKSCTYSYFWHEFLGSIYSSTAVTVISLIYFISSYHNSAVTTKGSNETC